MQYRPEIDGLRALAVAAVIANHFSNDLLPGGFLGVDVFFVVSGYVITASLYARSTTGLRTLLLDFYVRRIKRLLPALMLFVLVTSALMCLFNSWPTTSIRTGLAALLGVSNLYLVRIATDYFGDSAQLNAFTHTWSLGVEEQFYVLFPFIVWATGFRRDNGGRTGSFHIVLGVLSAASLAAFIQFNRTSPSVVYFLMPPRFWELGSGSLAFAITQRTNISGPAAPGVKVASVVALGITGATLMASSGFSTLTTIAAVALTVALICLTRPGTLVHALFTTRLMVYLGLISYSLYLWHWGVLTISHWTVGIHPWSAPIQLALMLLLAAGSYQWVEKPLRRAKWSVRQWPTIAYGFGAAAIAAGMLWMVAKLPAGYFYIGRVPRIEATGSESLDHVYALDGFTWNAKRCALHDNNEVGKVITLEGCTLGDFARAKTRVLALGNSWSAALTHSFDQLVRDDHFAITITSSWGASPIKEVSNHGAWSKANEYYWSSVVPDLVAQLKAGDWVLLLSEMSIFMPTSPSPEQTVQLNQLRAGLGRFSKELDLRGIRLAVLNAQPHLRESNCGLEAGVAQWFSPFGSPCTYFSRQTWLERRAALDGVLNALAHEHRMVIIDPFDLFCPGPVCNHVGRNQLFLYRDIWSHPSIEAARQMAPYFRAALGSGVEASAQQVLAADRGDAP